MIMGGMGVAAHLCASMAEAWEWTEVILNFDRLAEPPQAGGEAGCQVSLASHGRPKSSVSMPRNLSNVAVVEKEAEGSAL